MLLNDERIFSGNVVSLNKFIPNATFTGKNATPLEIEDKVNLALVFNKEKADTQWV